MDSPGFSAQYCTYTLINIDNDTTDIATIVFVDKREVDSKSINMEKLGFIKGIEAVRQQGVNMDEVVTDSHIQIMALISKKS